MYAELVQMDNLLHHLISECRMKQFQEEQELGQILDYASNMSKDKKICEVLTLE